MKEREVGREGRKEKWPTYSSEQPPGSCGSVRRSHLFVDGGQDKLFEGAKRLLDWQTVDLRDVQVGKDFRHQGLQPAGLLGAS